MPDKYRNSGHPERPNHPKHIKNTDNESTQFFSRPSDKEDTAELNYRRYPQDEEYYDDDYHEYPQQHYDGEYGNHPYSSSRDNYYGSDSPINMRKPVSDYSSSGQYRQASASGQRQSQGNRPSQRPNTQRRKTSDGSRNTPPPPQRPNRNSSGNRPNPGRRPPDSNDNYRRRPPVQQKKQKKERKKRSFIVRLLLILLILFLIIFGAYSCTALSLINKLNYQESTPHSHSANALSSSHVTNILLIGTDSRTLNERGRSDTMILLSLNSKTDEITLTSFMRDSYVDIPGKGMDKLTHAYSYGGADLLMETIENNFAVRIDDYMSVNFNSFASIVDSVGGVVIEVSDAEAKEINTILMAEVNELMGDPVDSDLLNGGGKLKLNGKQALSYSRIRYVGNNDFERTQRQRAVLTQIASKLKTFKPSMISSVAEKAIPQVSTNMEKSQLYMLSLKLPFIVGDEIKQVQIPAEGTYTGEKNSSGAVLRVDFDANHDIIKKEVFGE